MALDDEMRMIALLLLSVTVNTVFTGCAKVDAGSTLPSVKLRNVVDCPRARLAMALMLLRSNVEIWRIKTGELAEVVTDVNVYDAVDPEAAFCMVSPFA